MKLLAALFVLYDTNLGFLTAIIPTLKVILANPTLLFRPKKLSRTRFALTWQSGCADYVDGLHKEGKTGFVTPNARGVVLDIGAGKRGWNGRLYTPPDNPLAFLGSGHTIKYLDPTLVTKYVALEPNTAMHANIRRVAAEAGFTYDAGNFVLLGCGAENLSYILQRIPQNSVDTIICMHTMCCWPELPSPKLILRALVDHVLAERGQLLVYEHVLSHRADVAWWQRLWTPLWAYVFDGCHMNRPSLIWAEESGDWEESKVWGFPGQPEENLFWHQIGMFVKA